MPPEASAPSAHTATAYRPEVSAPSFSYLLASSRGSTKARVGRLSLGVVLALIAYAAYAWTSAPLGPSSYFADAGAKGRITITWVDDGDGRLAGSIRTISPNPALPGGPVAGTPTDLPFTGVLREGHVSLVSNAGTPTSQTIMGTVEGDSMTLKMIGTDGQMDFTRTTPGKVVHLGPWTWTPPF